MNLQDIHNRWHVGWNPLIVEIKMLQHALILSLQITAIHMLFQEGMLLGWFRIEVANYLDERLGVKRSQYIQKPIFTCLTCMAGMWTIVLTLSFDIKLILVVCGINTIISNIIDND